MPPSCPSHSTHASIPPSGVSQSLARTPTSSSSSISSRKSVVASTSRLATPLTMDRRRTSPTTGATGAVDNAKAHALGSDEFIRTRRKRGSDHQGDMCSSASTRTGAATTMSRTSSSTSGRSAPLPSPGVGTGSVPTSSGAYSHASTSGTSSRSTRPHSSLSSRHPSRSHSRSRTPRPAPAASSTTPPLPIVPTRSVSSSSCPEPRGATLAVAPQTSTSDVTAEGELEVTARIGAAEVLGELRDGGRSGANSEYGDDDRDQDFTLPISVPNHQQQHLAALDNLLAASSLPSPPHSSPPSHRSHLVRPEATRLRTSPAAILMSASSDVVPEGNGIRRFTPTTPTSPMSTSPPTLSRSFGAGNDDDLPDCRDLSTLSDLPQPYPDQSRPRHRGSSTSSATSSTHSSPRRTSAPLSNGDALNTSVTDKRQRRSSHQSQSERVAKTSVSPPRPQLQTYVSFEAAFDLRPPPSPPPSPKELAAAAGGKGWWRGGA